MRESSKEAFKELVLHLAESVKVMEPDGKNVEKVYESLVPAARKLIKGNPDVATMVLAESVGTLSRKVDSNVLGRPEKLVTLLGMVIAKVWLDVIDDRQRES